VSRVLVVDDEPQIRRALAINLRARGYQVDLAATGEEALNAVADQPPDVVVLDLGLPGISGLQVIQGLRGWTRVPIIVLSVREREADKVAALDAGADDYVTKPFGINELLARLRAAVRRATPTNEQTPVVQTPDFRVDLAAKQVTRNDREVRLTPTEWQLVELLVRHPGRLVSQRQLLQEVWGPTYREETNYLRIFIAQIRRKLEPEPTPPPLLHHRTRHGLPVPTQRPTQGAPPTTATRQLIATATDPMLAAGTPPSPLRYVGVPPASCWAGFGRGPRMQLETGCASAVKEWPGRTLLCWVKCWLGLQESVELAGDVAD
jgi:two-component system KDP operon response regulator KdpE